MNSTRGVPGGKPGRLSPADYVKEQQTVDDRVLNFKELQGFVTRVTGKCFKTCVNSFETSQMSQDERACLDNCIRRAQNAQTEANAVIPEVENKFM